MSNVGPDYIDQATLDDICDYMAEGNSVRAFFREKRTDLSRNWFHVWLSTHGTDVQRNQYVRAQEDRQDAIFENCLDIADDSTGDLKTVTRKDGSEVDVCDTEFVQRSRLRVETRLKVLARMNPKKYGERLNTAISDPDGNAMKAAAVTVYILDNGRETSAEGE